MFFVKSDNQIFSSISYLRFLGLIPQDNVPVFVAASHQTRLDTKSKPRKPIKVGIKGRGGRERIETRTLLVSAAHRLT